jgi:putative transposase
VERSSSRGGMAVNLSKQRIDLLSKLLVSELPKIVADGVHGWLRERGVLLTQLLMNAEVQQVVGDRGIHDRNRDCVRWGTQDGSVLLLEQRIPVKKPRVRTGSSGTEVELEIYEALKDKTFLNEQAAAKLLSGLSTRRFEKTLEKTLRGRGIGRQTISTRGIQEMNKQLAEFQSRSLSGLGILTVFIDGIHLADDVYVAAVGIGSDGKRHVLGFEPGSTESSGVCRSLLSGLIERGALSEAGEILFVVDGGKGLFKAIQEVFGRRAEIQRCTLHKKRNVEEKLPEKLRQEFRHKFNAAYAKESLKEAEKAFSKLRDWLILNRRQAAANSLLEGQQQILTLHRLGITGTLRRSLCTTNCIESVFSAARYYTRNVKRWRDNEQMSRWIASGLLEAEKNLRRIPGYTQLKALKKALSKKA